jgi:hypothetical protein
MVYGIWRSYGSGRTGPYVLWIISDKKSSEVLMIIVIASLQIDPRKSLDGKTRVRNIVVVRKEPDSEICSLERLIFGLHYIGVFL